MIDVIVNGSFITPSNGAPTFFDWHEFDNRCKDLSVSQKRQLINFVRVSHAVIYAECLFRGYLVDKNQSYAIRILAELADKNNINAKITLAYFYSVIGEDKDKNLSILEDFAKNGYASAQYYLALNKPEAEQRDLVEKAYQAGHLDAAIRYCRILNKGSSADKKLAEKIFEERLLNEDALFMNASTEYWDGVMRTAVEDDSEKVRFLADKLLSRYGKLAPLPVLSSASYQPSNTQPSIRVPENRLAALLEIVEREEMQQSSVVYK